MLPKTDMLEGEVIWDRKDTLAEVTFPSHNAAEYIELAQLLAMDYFNMLTAVAVRKQTNIKYDKYNILWTYLQNIYFVIYFYILLLKWISIVSVLSNMKFNIDKV